MLTLHKHSLCAHNTYIYFWSLAYQQCRKTRSHNVEERHSQNAHCSQLIHQLPLPSHMLPSQQQIWHWSCEAGIHTSNAQMHARKKQINALSSPPSPTCVMIMLHSAPLHSSRKLSRMYCGTYMWAFSSTRMIWRTVFSGKPIACKLWYKLNPKIHGKPGNFVYKISTL